MSKEIWKDIKEYDGKYQVSNLGNVRNNKNHILKPSKNRKGYLNVVLYKNNASKTLRIHRLVALTYISNPNKYPQVNHIDGNKENNKVDNLEWCNNSINQKHAFINGLQKDVNGANNPNARKINQYDLNNNFIKQWDCIKDIEDALHIHRSNIWKCCIGKYLKSHNYIWKYANE